jgi:hypothetical protein
MACFEAGEKHPSSVVIGANGIAILRRGLRESDIYGLDESKLNLTSNILGGKSRRQTRNTVPGVASGWRCSGNGSSLLASSIGRLLD